MSADSFDSDSEDDMNVLRELQARVQQLEQEKQHLTIQNEEMLSQISTKLDQQPHEQDHALHEGEAQYRSLIDQAMDSFFVFDTDTGQFLDANAAACRNLGYSKEDMLNLAISDIMETQETDFLSRTMVRLEEEGAIVLEGNHLRKDGSHFPVEMHLSMTLFKGHIRVLAIAHDITLQRQTEEQLLQAQKMEGIGTLVGGIAHDFNNMLAGMKGNLYLIEHDRSLSSDSQIKVERLNQLCDQAANMIAQLLTFARKGIVQMHGLEFSAFLQEALELSEIGVPENIHITHDFDAGLTLPVMGDKVQLQQMLLNLLVNARDAVKGRAEPEIRISLKRVERSARLHEQHHELGEGPWLELSVQDNGCGIPELIRDQLYDPFFTTKDVDEGTGLGLSTVYGVVQSHLGCIELDSVESEGSNFRIYLPLQGELEQHTGSRASALPRGNGEMILLVDDEEIVRTTTSALLQHLGYQVITAYNGFQALSKAQEEHIDLVLLDVVMPEMGGVETAEKLRRMMPDMPIVFATAYDRNLVLSKKPLPDCMILNKPFRLQMLANTLHTLLDKG